jgi:hypothetical protein
LVVAGGFLAGRARQEDRSDAKLVPARSPSTTTTSAALDPVPSRPFTVERD